MNAPNYCEAAGALAETIDGISKQVSTIALGAATLASPSCAKPFEPTPDAGDKNKENLPSSAASTPQSGMQSECAYLSRELKSGTARVMFPSLKKTPAINHGSRKVRKWKLKPHSSLKATAAPSYADPPEAKIPSAPWFLPANEAPPETPYACQLTSPPQLTLRRKHNALQPLPPPNLREAEFRLQTGQDFVPALKPRPTVLFQTPRKRQRLSNEENARSDEADNPYEPAISSK